VLDLGFSRSKVRFGPVERLVLRAVENLTSVWPAGALLIVLVEKVPRRSSAFAAMLSFEGIEGSVLFVDTSGNVLADPSVALKLNSTDLSEAARQSPEELRSRALAKTLRRRGVFRVSTSPRLEYSTLKFSSSPNELGALLAEFFAEKSVDVAIVDDEYASWLHDAVARSQSLVGRDLARYSLKDLDLESDERKLKTLRRNARAAVRDADEQICLLLPMVKNGERINHLFAKIARFAKRDLLVLSIFMSDVDSRISATPSMANRLSEGDTGSVASRVQIPTSTGDVDVHYFTRGDIRRVGQESWQVLMAKFFREDLEDGDPVWKPSAAGLWMLLNEGASTSNYEKTDHGVLMRMRLDEFDHGWLAASLVQLVLRERHWLTSEVLFVTPDDPSSISPIALKLREQFDVAIVQVPRADFSASSPTVTSEVRDKLLRYSSQRIVVADESAVTYKTMHGLRLAVSRAIGREPDLYVSILDLSRGEGEPPLNYMSMFQWTPLPRSDVRNQSAQEG